MIVSKYYCDSCKNEISEDDFWKVNGTGYETYMVCNDCITTKLGIVPPQEDAPVEDTP